MRACPSPASYETTACAILVLQAKATHGWYLDHFGDEWVDPSWHCLWNRNRLLTLLNEYVRDILVYGGELILLMIRHLLEL